jgi:hypothetical protein
VPTRSVGTGAKKLAVPGSGAFVAHLLVTLLQFLTDLPTLLGLDATALVLAAMGLQGRHRSRLAVIVHGNHGKETAVGMTYRTFTDIFRDHLDPHFHGRVAGVVDRGQERDQFAHMDRLAKNHLIDREGHYVPAGIPAGTCIGNLVKVLEQGAAMDIAREVGHVRGHQDGH